MRKGMTHTTVALVSLAVTLPAYADHRGTTCRDGHSGNFCSVMEQRATIEILKDKIVHQQQIKNYPITNFKVVQSYNLIKLKNANSFYRAKLYEWIKRQHNPWDSEFWMRHHFGSHTDEAFSVCGCESRLVRGGTLDNLERATRAGVGKHQYLGMFQMGEYARGRYGHGHTPREQIAAASGYYHAAGWGPWQCIPFGGLRW